MHRDIVWEWADRPGLEHCSVTATPDGVAADGVALFVLEGTTWRLRYRLACDAAWRFAKAELTLDGVGESRTLTIDHGADGWRVDGQDRPDLGPCIDIDIRATPFTNTLPLRRLDLRAGEPQEAVVAYVSIPDLGVSPVRQRYTRLAGPGGYRYENLDNGFVADLTVDDDGLVVDYPGPWRRRGG
jgi:hypothetical protein